MMKITGLQDVDFSAQGKLLELRTGETVEAGKDIAELAISHGMAEPAAAGAKAKPTEPAAAEDGAADEAPAHDEASDEAAAAKSSKKRSTKKAAKKRSKKK